MQNHCQSSEICLCSSSSIYHPTFKSNKIFQAWQDLYKEYDHKDTSEEALWERIKRKNITDAIQVYKKAKAESKFFTPLPEPKSFCKEKLIIYYILVFLCEYT